MHHGQQKKLSRCCATLLLGSYEGQEESTLEIGKGTAIGVGILFKDGRYLVMKIPYNRHSCYR